MAYTVCIAEDEYYVQKSIEARINAMRKNIEVLDFAFDGIEAEELYYKFRPDIFFVDISMPQCSGLEFIEKIRQEDSECKTVFIIVSSYSDYNNMRRAINVNVFDYLKKPIVPSEFVDIVDRAIEQVEKQRSEMNGTEANVVYYDDYLRGNGNIELNGTLLMILTDSAHCTEKSSEDVGFLIKHFQKEQQGLCIAFRNTEFVKLLLFEGDLSGTKRFEKLTIQHKLSGISVFHTEMLGEKIEETLKKLAGEMNRRFFELNYFYHVKEYRKIEEKTDLSYILMKPTLTDITEQLKELWKSLCDAKEYDKMYRFYYDFLFVLAKKYDEAQIPIPEQIKRDMLQFSMARFRTAKEVESYLQLCAQQYFECMEQRKPKDLMDQICDYIQVHYMEALTLNDLADHFHISSSYLSHSFTKKKQLPIVKYIGEVRLEKAAGYLKNTQIPIADIAEWTGYSDSNYFSKAFRKKYGYSPGDYRKKWQNI